MAGLFQGRRFVVRGAAHIRYAFGKLFLLGRQSFLSLGKNVCAVNPLLQQIVSGQYLLFNFLQFRLGVRYGFCKNAFPAGVWPVFCGVHGHEICVYGINQLAHDLALHHIQWGRYVVAVTVRTAQRRVGAMMIDTQSVHLASAFCAVPKPR